MPDNHITGGLPPLADEERARVRTDFAQWHDQHAGPDYDFTDGEATWEWAYWHYKRQIHARARHPRRQPYKGPINRPCSACSAGDTAMEYHDHDYVDEAERRPYRWCIHCAPDKKGLLMYQPEDGDWCYCQCHNTGDF